jgi:hypothetical protein
MRSREAIGGCGTRVRREVGAVLDIAEAYGWLTVDAGTRDLLDEVQRTLAKLARR